MLYHVNANRDIFGRKLIKKIKIDKKNLSQIVNDLINDKISNPSFKIF